MKKSKNNKQKNKQRNDEEEKEDKVVVEENDVPVDDEEEEGDNGTEKPEQEPTTEAQQQRPLAFESDGKYRNKQRCLVLCMRGATARYRHLLEDLRTLIPHHKKESKLDPGKKSGMASAVNDIAEMRSCNTVLFLECRKHQDAYLWIGNVGGGGGAGGTGGTGTTTMNNNSIVNNGPSAKFHVSNVHTMDELRLTGNCMRGSRPIVTFDESFNRVPHLKLLKELFTDVFGTPRGHPKSKPFVDRVMAFYYADKKIWVRNYQILEQQPTNALEAHLAKKQSGQEENTSLVEIGPRFVLNPIRIFRGSFGGQTLFQNPDFVSPNDIRAMQYKRKGNSYEQRKMSQKRRKTRQEQMVLPKDPLDDVFR